MLLNHCLLLLPSSSALGVVSPTDMSPSGDPGRTLTRTRLQMEMSSPTSLLHREESSGEQGREGQLEILTEGDSARPPSRPIRQQPPLHTTLSQSKDWRSFWSSEAELEQHLRFGFGFWQQQDGGCLVEFTARTEEKRGAKQYHTKHKRNVSTSFSDLVAFSWVGSYSSLLALNTSNMAADKQPGSTITSLL